MIDIRTFVNPSRGLFIVLLVITVQQQGWSQSKNYGRELSGLAKLIYFCDSTHADEVLLYHKGNVVMHQKNEKCDSIQMKTASLVKSWTGLLTGILIDKKIVGGVEDPVCKYIPEWKEGCSRKITLRHLLTMTAGLDRKGGAGVLSQPDMNAYVLNIKSDTLPGIRFAYSNESVQLLGIILERASGKKLDQLFREYLFEPLEMYSTTLARDAAGNFIAYGGAETTVHDALQVGKMMLENGVYRENRIVSRTWVKQSTTASSLTPYFGYLWWIDSNSKYSNYAAMGDLGQLTIVFPDLDLVFIRRQNCDLSPASRNMTWMGPKFLDRIVRAVRAKP